MRTLSEIHSKLIFHGGDITTEEIEEQRMSIRFIKPTDCVLELGANIGRNSLVIASLLEDSSQLTVLESSPSDADILKLNRDANGFKFTILTCALSKRPLIQKGWDTKVYRNDEPIPEGWSLINTLDLDGLRKKMSQPFNVLVCDCEGCLYQILIDEPLFLTDSVTTVIIENDYGSQEESVTAENYVKNYLSSLGFVVVYNQPLLVYTPHPEFWQVWQR